MTTRIKLRRDTAANWTSANPVLALGEPGYDTTNNKLKIGDGTTVWQDLDYLTDESISLTGLSTSGSGTSNVAGTTVYTLGINTESESNDGIEIKVYAGGDDAYPAIAIGQDNGGTHRANVIAIGNNDVGYNSLPGGVYIGHGAGFNNSEGPQGLHSIAIGSKAAWDFATNNSITINATGDELNPDESGLFIKPIREEQYDDVILYYNTTSGEVTYAANPGSGGLTSDHNIAITVGNTEYFAIVNRANNDDDGVEASAVAYDSANNIITLHVSEIYNDNTDTYDDILIISKFDDTGALQWQKQIDQDIDDDTVHDLAVDEDDNIIVAVTVDGTPNSIALIKFDSLGGEIWQKDYVGSLQYSWMELGGIVLSGTDIFIAGEYIEDDNVGTPIIGLLMKVSATDGTLDWATTLPYQYGTYAWGVDVTTGGDPVIVGRIGNQSGQDAAIVIRFDGTDGTEVWSKILFPTEANTSYAGGDIVIDSQNNIFVSVNSNQYIVHDDGDNTTVTIAHVAKLNSAGATQWIRRIGPGPCASVATGIDCDSTGNVYLAALTVAQDNPTREANDFASTGRNVLAIAKYSTAGAVLWQRYIETDSYEFINIRDNDNGTGNFSYAYNRGRNMSVGLNGKLAIQTSVRQIDADDWWDNTRYVESITFQIDQDGRTMTVGSGNEKFTVKESRIPGRFITIESYLDSGNLTLSNLTSNVTVTTGNLVLSDGELAQQVNKSAAYEYVFGNDGTLIIPNDGDVRLTQTQIGWFSIYGPANNNNDDVWIRANCVDTATGDVYAVGQDDVSNDGFVVRYNSQGQILWSVKLFDITDEYNTRCNAVKIHPVTGNVVVLAEYYGNQTGALLLQIDPDTARVVTSTGFRDLDENNGVQACDLDFLSDGKIVVVGQKYDEYQSYSVTSNTAISTTGLLVFNRSDIPGKTITNSNWYVGGTGINTRVAVDSVNFYPGLTGTVRQGSGATFNVVANDGDPGVYTANVAAGGTNYLVGHRIKIPGTSLGGATPDNDLILTVATVSGNAIATIDSLSGTADGGAQTTYSAVSGTNYLTGSGFAFDFAGDDANIYTEHATTITNVGNNYVSGDTIVIPGTQLGGNTTAHDLTITVSASNGNVISINSSSGNAQTNTWHIRTTAETPNFGNVSGAWSLQQPLSGEAFVYVGTAANANVSFGPVWTRTLSAGGTNDNERYFSVAVDASDNIYAVGEMVARNDAAGVDLNSYWCAVVSKFNSSGTHQWTKALNTTLNDNYAKSVAVQGNVVVVSQENISNGTTVVTKLDNTGAVKWQRRAYTGDDSSVAIDTNGDIYAVAEAVVESTQYGNCIKVIKFNSVGEIVWRKILATQVAGNNNTSEYFKNGRNLTLDADHLYISGYTTAFDNNFENGFLVKLPKSGDCDGVYGGWTIMTDAYDVDKVYSTEATAFTPNVNTGEFETWEPDFETDWWDPSGNSYYHTFEEIRDRDGGAIEFADGTRQTSSAQMIPQKKISNGADHRLSLEDMGRHIYITDNETKIAVPYHQDNPLPVGFTVVIINNSNGNVSIDGDGGGVSINVPGVATGGYWDLATPGMATLIKVEEGDTWFMTGHVTEVI